MIVEAAGTLRAEERPEKAHSIWIDPEAAE
jgi:hypothetical protein